MKKWRFLSKKEEKKEIRYILSIDGGGIRGFIPAHILKQMSLLMKEAGDERPLYSHFDLIAGTSTGSLLALGLSMPSEQLGGVKLEEGAPYSVTYSFKPGLFKKEVTLERGRIYRSVDPEYLEDLYREKRGEIFKPKTGLKALFGNVFDDKYDTSAYEAFLSRTYNDAELSELMVPTIAICFNTTTCKPYVFRSYASDGFLVKEAARASSAAPLYFSPAKFINRRTNEEMSLIDGGVGANNPALIAYTEAMKLYPNASEFRILSLSTCSPPFSYDAASQSGGVLGWARQIFRLYSESELAITDLTMENIPSVSYTRVWTDKLSYKVKLDDITNEGFDELAKGAEAAYVDNKEQIEEFVRELVAEPVHDSVKLNTDQKLLEA